MGITMVRTVEDMYLVLLLTARVLHKVRIKRGKGRRMVAVRDEVKMANKRWMFLSMGMEGKARGTTGRPDKKDRATEESDSHNPTTSAEEHYLCSCHHLLLFLR
jgi:hypothetical protein